MKEILFNQPKCELWEIRLSDKYPVKGRIKIKVVYLGTKLGFISDKSSSVALKSAEQGDLLMKRYCMEPSAPHLDLVH